MFKVFKVNDGPVHAGKKFVFNSGVTAITGPNGCGKSLLVEYMAFALFGTSALRGKVTDYKNLSVEAIVRINNADYTIERSTKNCNLYDFKKELICTGTKPCNLKIISLLGYDYNVYKMGNYAAQLDILGLGNMKPSERKTALDRTLGIGAIDKLIKYTKETSLKNQHSKNSLVEIAVDPGEAPEKPEGYRDVSEIGSDYNKLREEQNRYMEFLNTPIPQEPKEPMIEENLAKFNSKELSSILIEKTKLETRLLQFKEIEAPLYSEEELDKMLDQHKKYEAYSTYLKQISGLDNKPLPKESRESLSALKTSLSEWEVYDQEKKLYDLSIITCPHCGKTFSNSNKEPKVPSSIRPNCDRSYLREQEELILIKEKLDSIEKVEQVSSPEVSLYNIKLIKDSLPLWKQKLAEEEGLKSKLAEINWLNTDSLQRVIDYEQAQSKYEIEKNSYQTKLVEYNKKKEFFRGINLEDYTREIDRVYALYIACTEYNNQKAIWDTKKAEFDRLQEQINKYDQEAQRYSEATERLKKMKIDIKGYVLPSLQKVSSLLLSEMSEGLYTDIKISPDFDILVENREINLFSGSEQAMINLALRLGLGQVLTHKVFSSFIGDEIDASMREERAQLTADCLQRVSKYLKQIILVSHRNIQAEHYIDLN